MFHGIIPPVVTPLLANEDLDLPRFTWLLDHLISQNVHAYLKEKNVPHIWHVDEHSHDFDHWRKGLYRFAQLIFQPPSK